MKIPIDFEPVHYRAVVELLEQLYLQQAALLEEQRALLEEQRAVLDFLIRRIE